jgi:hypothetical protein
LARVQAGDLQVKDAAVLMRISYRQAKRLWKRYQAKGATGLKHGNAGRRSNRARASRERKKILGLVRNKYAGFGPTLAAEHLSEEDGEKIHGETLRRWMLEEGLWKRARKAKQHRKRRDRRAHFGELVQMDGSFHDWYQGRGPVGCLMNMVDDATSTVEARLGDQETIWAATQVLRQWIGKYGIPLALYTDWKNVYARKPTEKERLKGTAPVTQFGRMCRKLDIRILTANSPQAKGRVERGNGTHQDRMIKKMGLQKIGNHEAANRYMQERYLPDHNRRFAVKATAPQNYHRKAPRAAELEQIFCLETERTVSNAWVVRYENRYFQLRKQSGYAPSQSKVTVCEWESGRIEIQYRSKAHAYEEIGKPETPAPLTRAKKPAHRPAWHPGQGHPWRKPWKRRVAAVPEEDGPTSAKP